MKKKISTALQVMDALGSWPLVVDGLPEADYHAVDAMSASRLKILDKGTSLHLAHSLSYREVTEALAVGSALHSAVLTPKDFSSRFVVAPDINRRTNAGKEEWQAFLAANSANTVIDRDDMSLVNGMSASVLRHDAARQVLSELDGRSEVSLFAKVGGMAAKCRIDRLVGAEGEFIVADLKSTVTGAGRSEFERTIWNYGYGIQSAFYLSMCRACGIDAKHFVFVVVEKKAPYATAVYRMSERTIDLFSPRIEALIERYREFIENGPKGYEGCSDISVPAWALNQLENESEAADGE